MRPLERPPLTLADRCSAGYLLGIGRLIGFLSDRYGNGQGLVTIAAPEFYTKKAPIFAAAAKVLSSAAPKAPKPPGLSPDGSLGRSQRTKKEAIVFNVDVAKAMVVLCVSPLHIASSARTDGRYS